MTSLNKNLQWISQRGNAGLGVTTLVLFTGFVMPEGLICAQTNEQGQSIHELKHLSLEQLMNVDVITVSRRPEPWFTAPSAIQVLTAEEIRRSGATLLPEALRLAPSLQVAQVDSRQWAVSARGFNNTLANKLLVMIDGRTVYTPLFAGVFWDVQDVMLEDLDRIEAVSGPGGTLWGANAVNGVINIITKSAKDTQGALVSAGGGSFLQDYVAARYGGMLSTNVYYRVYGKYFDHDNALLPNGADSTNSWRFGQGGFRLDWLPRSGDIATLQFNGYGGGIEQVAPGDTAVNGQNLLGRWTHSVGDLSDITVQLYWDRTYRDIPNQFAEDLNTYDLDFQHSFALGARHHLTWGLGYRLMIDHVQNFPGLAFLPRNRNLQLFSGFLQDEIVLLQNCLTLSLGTKLEHNDFSGFEVQPSGRLAWTPTERQTIWGAISRAVRSPSRIDTDLYFPNPASLPPGTAPTIAGGPNFDSEKLLAYELGYRIRPISRLTLSLAGFYNDYDDIRSLGTNALSNNSAVIANANRAEEWGIELSGMCQATDWWRLRGGYTFLYKRVNIKPGGSDLNRGRAEGNDPEHQFILQSMLDLPGRVQFDVTLRYVDRLPSPRVPSYFTADVRLGWEPIRNLELSIVGQNLLDPQHPEFGSPATRQEIPRSVFGKVTWRF